MSAFHEQYGKLAEENLELIDAYTRTLELVRNVKDGKISLSQITVREDGWDIEEAPSYEKSKAAAMAGSNI